MTDREQENEPGEVRGLINAIAGSLTRGGALSSGDVATLRRMDPRKPAPAFYKLEGLFFDESLPGDAGARAEIETRWAAIVVGLAHLGSLHLREHRLGDVLASAGFSEFRFARLVRADAERLVDDLPMLARFLAAKSAAVDWTGAAHLMLSADREGEEPVRRHLARDYYGALARGQAVRR